MIKQVKNNKNIGLDFSKDIFTYKNVSLPCLLSPNKDEFSSLTTLIHKIKDRELVTTQR